MFATKPLSRRGDIPRGILGHLSQVLTYNSSLKTFRGQHLVHKSRPQSVSAMSAGSDHYVFRKAAEADIAGILELSRRSLGTEYTTDYLPGWLPKALQDKSRIFCVGEKDTIIVAFVMGLCGVDCGKTLVAEAGRVAPDASGFGLIGIILSNLVAECVSKYPRYERLRSSSLLVDFFDKNLDKINLLAKRVYIGVHIPEDRMATVAALVSTHNVGVRKLSDAEYREVLSDKAITEKLYPQSLIAVGFNVFDAQPSNVHFITYFHDRILMNADERAISVGGLFPCNDGQSWRYNFNYSGVVDLTTCLAHLLEHLKLVAKETGDKDVHVFVSIDKAFKNLFGEDAIVHSLRESVGIDKDNIVMRLQYQYEFV